MHKNRWLVIPFLMIFAMGCGLISGVQGLQNAATTALPAVETSAPTEQGMLETMAAGQTGSSNCPSTPTAGGLGISIGTAKTLLQMSQQFAIADGSVGGQPAAIVGRGMSMDVLDHQSAIGVDPIGQIVAADWTHSSLHR